MTTEHSILFQSAKSLTNIDDNSIDLVVTSPPYPMIEMWDQIFIEQTNGILECLDKGDGYQAFQLMHGVLDRVWEECYRVLKPGGFICINIGDATRKVKDNFRLYSNHSRIISRCESLGLQSLPPILWRKQSNSPNKFMGSGVLPSGAYVTLEHEYILVFRKGNKKTFQGEDKLRRQQSSFFWEERNVWFSDMWDFKGTRQDIKNKKTRERSAAFPFELSFRLINMYSMQGDTILDPFAGTGTSTLAAMSSARNSIGVEIDEGFSEIIEETIVKSNNFVNKRQKMRIQDHYEFISNYKERKKKKLKYENSVHGFPVMTKQELNLTIRHVDMIEKTEKGVFRVEHSQYDIRHNTNVKFEGFEDRDNSGKQQMDLCFSN